MTPDEATVRVITDPHIQNAILLIGGALLGCFVLLILILADMTPINKDTDKDDFHPPFA
jgi:hypothetical protein